MKFIIIYIYQINFTLNNPSNSYTYALPVSSNILHAFNIHSFGNS